MAWFGDSLSSLSNLKGQITNFTKEVLSDGIVDEIDERSKALNEANERCNQLQDLLNSKDAEISLLRRQNIELQSAIIEMNERSKESKDTNHIDETEGVFCDPSCINNRNAKNQNVRQLQEQLAQATMNVRELEYELKHVQKVTNASLRDDISDGHQKAEVVRARQDMMNRIIQMEEKTREAERNAKHIQLDEASLINDFRSVMSKLNSREKFDLVSGALKALQIESEIHEKQNHEKSNEQLEKVDGIEYNTLTLRHHLDNISLQQKPSDATQELLINKREILLQQRIEELQNENKDLLDAMEKLDEEHTQSIEKLLSLREETNKKYRSLQNAYEQLSIDYNKSKKKIIEFRNNDLKLETSHQSVQTDNLDNLDKHTRMTVPFQRDDVVPETNILEDITRKIKIILKSYTITTIEPGETIFEAIAKQYVDTKWKLDVLERKVTEIIRDLKETKETKDVLQIECEELQSHIDSLLLENQVLKSSLPSIPEASEERVVSLEMEVESLREEIKRLSIENETIRETNTTLTLAVQDKGMFSTNHNYLQKDVNRKISDSFIKEDVEFPTCLEKNNSSNEVVVSIEQIKLDHENVTRELKLSVLETKLLENNLVSLQDRDIVDKLANENKQDLLQKNTQLYCTTLRECGLQEENDCQLHDLQKRLDMANREKSDLENDILRKEKELDAMQMQVDTKQSQIIKLNQDNDRLVKENISLSEQLTATHDESLDKIELLNTEMSLLQQEHKDLKQETSIYKEELNRTKDKLYEAQQRYAKLENEYYALKVRLNEQVELEKTKIQTQAIKMEELENELSLKQSFIEQLNFLRNRCKLLEQEIKVVRTKETQLLKSREDTSEISFSNIDRANNSRLQEELSTVEDNLVDKENVHVKTEIQDAMPRDISNNNEQQAFASIIDREKREKDIVQAHNKHMMNEITELRDKLQITIENSEESAEMAKQTIEGLSHLIREKDQEMSILQAEIDRANTVIAQTSNELVVIKNQKNELEQIVSTKHNENLQYQNEIDKLIQRVNEQTAQIQRLISEQTANEIQEEDANLKERQKERIQPIVDQQGGQSAEIVALNKKCDALEIALVQEQSNNRILQNQLIESQNREASSVKELERLRTHLVEIESSYTEEALIAENSRQELETRLLQAEEKVKSSSTAFTSANIRANQQIETLQQQIALITQQRDHIQAKLSATEDNIQLQSASLTNLQIVLEQFQQDKERDIEAATEKIRCQLNEAYKKQDEFLNEISILKQQLFEAKECLLAASRLSEQLEKKDEQIERLDEEVMRLTTSLNFAEQRVKEAVEHDEEKIDKILIKNLLLGYLSSTTSDKSAILRVFANVLNFTDSEKDKAGLNNGTGAQSGRFLRSYDKDGSVPLKYQEASLSTAFVRFLESESKPKPQLPPLPIVNSSSSRSGNKQQTPSSAQSTLLLSNVALPTFPDFIPARNTGSILKEVLKDS